MKKNIGFLALVVGIIDLFVMMLLMLTGNAFSIRGGFDPIIIFCFVIWFVCVIAVIFCLIVPFFSKLLDNNRPMTQFPPQNAGYCPYCGKVQNAATAFCPHCGARR